MDDTDDLVPMYVNILLPTGPHKRREGVFSTLNEDAGRIVTRFNAEEITLVEEVCEILETKMATFTRACVVQAARKVKEHYDAHLKGTRPGTG